MTDRPSDESGSDSGSSISDEEWERFLRESERGASDSVPREPSARARMVTERLRQQEARGERPEGWRSGPSSQWADRRARRRRWWTALGLTVAVAAAVVAVRPSLLPGDPFGTAEPDAAATSPLPAETAAPTAPPGATAPERPTLDKPFAGSPAVRWADGEAGITLPKATAVSGLSKAQVDQALRQTRELLIDANLNPATLRGARPKAALDVIEPHQTDLLTRLNTALRKPDQKHDPLSMFSRFDPDEVRLAGDVVKTRGRMTFKAGGHASLTVHADYTFVYPVVRADGPPDVTRTIVRRVLDLELPDPARYRVTPGKISVRRYDRETGNSACEIYDGFLHPHFDSSEPTGAAPSGPTLDPYDRSRDLDANREKDCGTVSRV